MWKLSLVVAALLLACAPAIDACPACNMGNYLAHLVSGGKEIFVGKAIESKGGNNYEFEVIRVTKGDLKPGEKAVRDLGGYSPDAGKVYLVLMTTKGFIPGDRENPVGQVLPESWEEEVAFLASNDRMIPTLGHALRHVCGVSKLTVELGQAYLTAQPDRKAVVTGLLDTLAKLKAATLSGDRDDQILYAISNCMGSLAFADTDVFQKIVLQEVDALLSSPLRSTNMSYIGHHGSPEGRYLLSVLDPNFPRHDEALDAAVEAHKAYLRKQRQRLKDALDSLDGQSLADALIVCYYPVSMTEPSLGKAAMYSARLDIGSRRDAVAMGLADLGQMSVMCFQYDDASAIHKALLKLPLSPGVKAELAPLFEHLKFMERARGD